MARFIAFVILGFGLSAHAGETYEFYNGIRGLGMGGAAIASVNDETALLVNPAGLGRLRDYYITLFDPEIEAGANTAKVLGTAVTAAMDPQKTLDKAVAKPGEHIHERAQLFPSIVVPNFGFGVFGRWSADAGVDPATGLFGYDYRRDYAAVFGFNFRLWNGIIKLGGTTRVVDRFEVRRNDIDTTSTDLTLSSLGYSGMGVAEDVGLMLTAPVAWLPTLAVVNRDVGRTSFTWRGGSGGGLTGVPDSVAGTVDVALAIHPIVGRRMRSTWTLQYDDVTSARAADALAEEDKKTLAAPVRKLHGGFEFNYADALFFRGGVNQRYWTAGVELAIVNYQFQAASYGEDIGTADLPKEDRRYVLKFSFRF